MNPQPIQVKNPATLQELRSFLPASPERVRSAVDEARKAFSGWASLPFKERGRYLLKARAYILDHLDEIAETISANNGKPKVESISADILPICDLLQYFACASEKLLKPERVSIGVMGLLGRKSTLYYEPLGVIGIISPWNFPFSIPMSGVAMSLIAGNCALLKPAEATAEVSFKIEEIFKAIGLPPGVFAHLPGGPETGEALLHSPLDKVIFTGSVRTGKRVMQICAERLIPCALELGGKDPMIVCEDADLENAARGAVWGAFCNAGQVCASVERLYVHEKIAAPFLEKVVQKTRELKVAPYTDWNADLGPLTLERQLQIVESHVEDAKSRGAEILTGGKRKTELPGYFYEPTVLTGVDHSFRCVSEETFGPLLPIMTFKTEEEAIQKANDSVYGLTASVWTKDLARGKKLAQKIRSGTVMINDCTYSYAISQTPWGGLKESGFGRTHGKIGLHELVHVKHIHENRFPKIHDFWWFKYDRQLYESFKYICKNLTGSFFQKMRGIIRVLKETLRKKG